MTRKQTLFTNAQIVTPDQVFLGSLVISEGAIEDIQSDKTHLISALDMEGDYLLPGLVEIHTDNLEKYIRPRPGVEWPVVPALLAHDAQVATSGITTVLDAIRIGSSVNDLGRPTVFSKILDGIYQAQRSEIFRANHYIHVRCEIGDPDVGGLFLELCTNNFIRLVSIMDHTPGQRQFADLERYRKTYGPAAGMHTDDLDDFIARAQELQARYAAPNRKIIAQAACQHGIAVASHDDTTPDHIDEAKALGITISEFPTSITAAKAAYSHGMATIAGAPNLVRGGSHSGNVAALDLAQQGLLSALSSDYMPVSLLHGAFILHWQGNLSLPQAIATATSTPAHLAGLGDRGSLALGQRADLLRVRIIDQIPVIKEVWRHGSRVA
ncbi:MAG: alpha-D-ribose 1-methylphosphonate 5-triphosphate diphosphatase [Alphaproteobacteria bacterium]